MINDYLERKFNFVALIAALLAVLGTGIVSLKGEGMTVTWLGFAVVQVSNLAFAFGQVAYRRVMAASPGVKDHQAIGWLYLGGVCLAVLATLLFGKPDLHALTFKQGWTLLYLGAVASGLGFFLWNLGARRTNPGALAVFNNLKTPLAVAVSLLVFGETANLTNLLLGGGVVLIALVINQYGWRKWIRPVKPNINDE